MRLWLTWQKAAEAGQPDTAEYVVRSSAEYLQDSGGCIVGSDLTLRGYTWNPVERDRVHRLVEAARSA